MPVTSTALPMRLEVLEFISPYNIKATVAQMYRASVSPEPPPLTGLNQANLEHSAKYLKGEETCGKEFSREKIQHVQRPMLEYCSFDARRLSG